MKEDGTTSRIRKILLIGAGGLFVGLGVAGIFLPLLPTTPFLLLAAACYANSSPRRLRRLLANRWFGRYLRDYRAGLGIPAYLKAWTLVLLWTTLTLSAVLATDQLWVRLLLGVILLGVSLHILFLPSSRS